MEAKLCVTFACSFVRVYLTRESDNGTTKNISCCPSNPVHRSERVSFTNEEMEIPDWITSLTERFEKGGESYSRSVPLDLTPVRCLVTCKAWRVGFI